ncbi:uncharacterized protein BDV17DRAFT_264535 [Aspergillus undulatus]|uniref:uncharacterized protein n=1 Tax=Aspergillus undulatus TaxID=1810928 RepID=UPI003CCD7360
MSLPQPKLFINNLLTQLAQLTTPTPPGRDEEDDIETQSQSQSQSQPQRPRLGHQQPASPFPSSQLANLKPLMLTLHCIFPNEFLLALDILDRGLVRRVRIRDGDGDETPTENSQSSGRQEDFFFVTSASTISSTPSSPKPRPPSSLFPASQARSELDHMHNEARSLKHWQEKGYEVRLQAWNCTCPPFTLSAFRDLGLEREPMPSSPPSSLPSSPSFPAQMEEHDDGNDKDKPAPGDADSVNLDSSPSAYAPAPAYSFGGTIPLHGESALPVCKHVLACLLAALCPGLGGGEAGVGSEVDGNGERVGRDSRLDRCVSIDREEVAALCAGWGG